jgi:Family of unknown function (DUF5677)
MSDSSAPLFVTPPDGESQEYRDLVGAFDCYLRDVARVVLADASPVGPVGRWVPYALFHHLMQLARAIQAGVRIGYSDEALPAGRSMLSAAANLIFIIGSGNPNGWALRYWLQVADVETRMLERELGLGRFDKTAIERILKDTEANREGAIAAATAEGITYPDKLIGPGRTTPRDDTWTGLSDKALFDRVGLADWYQTEYDYLSTITHAQAVCLLALRDQLMAGSKPSLGPHFRSPLPVIVSAFNSVKFASLAMVNHYGLSLPDIDRANAAMSSAVDAYKAAIDADAFVASVMGAP